MGKRADIPWLVGVNIPWEGGRYTMGRGIDMVGQYTIGRGSIYHE